MTDTAQPLLAHLTELRTRLLWALLAFGAAAVVSFLFVKPIYGFLVEPLARAMGPGDTNRLIYTDLTEAFFTYMKVALFSGFFITCPFLLWQVWHFIAPGLLDKEKRTVLPFLIATPALFFIGAAFVYYLILPIAWPFFLSFQSGGGETALPIQLEARVGEYLHLIMTMIFAFGLCFEMPVVLVLLARAGMITAETLAKGRRYAIVIIFSIAAVLTPPDVMSQCLLGVPMLALYELSIFLIRLDAKSRRAV